MPQLARKFSLTSNPTLHLPCSTRSVQTAPCFGEVFFHNVTSAVSDTIISFLGSQPKLGSRESRKASVRGHLDLTKVSTGEGHSQAGRSHPHLEMEVTLKRVQACRMARQPGHRHQGSARHGAGSWSDAQHPRDSQEGSSCSSPLPVPHRRQGHSAASGLGGAPATFLRGPRGQTHATRAPRHPTVCGLCRSFACHRAGMESAAQRLRRGEHDPGSGRDLSSGCKSRGSDLTAAPVLPSRPPPPRDWDPPTQGSSAAGTPALPGALRLASSWAGWLRSLGPRGHQWQHPERGRGDGTGQHRKHTGDHPEENAPTPDPHLVTGLLLSQWLEHWAVPVAAFPTLPGRLPCWAPTRSLSMGISPQAQSPQEKSPGAC